MRTPNPGITLPDSTDDNRTLKVESSDWESRIAKLVGLEVESDVSDTIASSDAILQPLSKPREVQTQRPFSSNPLTKLGLVGTATLAIVLLAGVFLFQMMNTSSQKSKTNVVPPLVQLQPTIESSSQQLEAEVETLKTKLALSEQAELVKTTQQQLRIAKSKPVLALKVNPLNSARDRQRAAIKITPTPVKKVYLPRRVIVEHIVKVPVFQPFLTSQKPIVKPDIQPVIKIASSLPPNPLNERTTLAKLDSYKQANLTEQPNTRATISKPGNDIQSQQKPPNPNLYQMQPPQTLEVRQVQQQQQKSVVVGSSAKAVLATAVFGETTRSKNNEKNKNIFVIRLKTPLKAVDGTVAVPVNTEFLAEIRSLSEQGLLQMNVIKIISQNNGQFAEKNLPNNAIIIKATQGKPLIANKFPDQSSSITLMDGGLFILGGISKATELINRSDSEIVPLLSTAPNAAVPNSNSSQFTTVTKNRRDLAAGIVEGGLNSVVPQIVQRNQQALAQISQKTNIWFLPAGKDVEVYVNQLILY